MTVVPIGFTDRKYFASRTDASGFRPERSTMMASRDKYDRSSLTNAKWCGSVHRQTTSAAPFIAYVILPASIQLVAATNGRAFVDPPASYGSSPSRGAIATGRS